MEEQVGYTIASFEVALTSRTIGINVDPQHDIDGTHSSLSGISTPYAVTTG